jgi:DNA-binding MarR family transcriptional regulator
MADFLDILDPNTGQILYRAEQRRNSRKTPAWMVIWRDNMEDLCRKLTSPEVDILHWFIRNMQYGNLVRLGPFDVARRYGIKKGTAYKHLAKLVKAGALQKIQPDLYKVSLNIAWRGSIKDWHKYMDQ